MNETGLHYKSCCDGNKNYIKFRIKNGNIDIIEMNKKLSHYNGYMLIEAFETTPYAQISNMNGIIKIKDGNIYFVLSFIDIIDN
jgi:hypothetical protein